jgi:flagellar motor protein MotB
MILDDGLSASEHVEEDENYFVSMTDMMVGVLFIFLIMLMLFALNFRKQTDISEDRIIELKKKEQQLKDVSAVADDVARRLDALRAEVGGELADMDRASKVRTELLNALRDQLRAQGLDVQIDEVNGVLRLTENAIRFPVNKSDLDAKATENVDKVATALGIVLPRYTGCHRTYTGVQCEQHPEGATVETVFIEGHTDVTGGDDRNWPLSTARAVTTYREMTGFVPELRSLANSRGSEIMSVSGYASTRPVDPDGTDEAYARNRRIDLRFVMENDSRQRLGEILQATDEMKKELDRLHRSVEQVQ